MATYLYRGVSSAILVVLVLSVLYAGGLVLFLACAITALLGVYEFWNMAKHGNHHPSLIVSGGLALGFLFAVYIDTRLTALVLGIVIVTSIFWLRLGERSMPQLLSDWTLTFMGGIYTGGILQYAVLLRALPNGVALGLLTLLGTWLCDTGAYLIGTKWGRRKFAPRLSPSKTWEGAIGGFVLSFLVVVGSGYVLQVPLVHAFSLGVLIPIAVILGDLTESLIKRSNGVKDSGNLIPGHGGVLDRIDGLLFAILAVYAYCVWFF